ncbi:MAG: hypothetical protein Q7R78_01140 [bacterium]|nr:hypothetical protein [bacterium]
MKGVFRNRFFTKLRFERPRIARGVQFIKILSKEDEERSSFVFVAELDIKQTHTVFRVLNCHWAMSMRTFGLKYFLKSEWAEFSIPLTDEEMDEP